MSNIENRCIAYIYNEMDPSERLEFERELEQDDNLLIELESLKRTAASINKIKCVQPPESIVNSVKNDANSIKKRRKSTGVYRYLFASAAITLFTVLAYGAILVQEPGTSSSSDTDGSEISTASVTSTKNLSAAPPVKNGEESRVSPWVDHEDVIHFHERFNRGSVASIDSMFNKSMEKLTRVRSEGAVQQVQQQIHLTGSNR